MQYQKAGWILTSTVKISQRIKGIAKNYNDSKQTTAKLLFGLFFIIAVMTGCCRLVIEFILKTTMVNLSMNVVVIAARIAAIAKLQMSECI